MIKRIKKKVEEVFAHDQMRYLCVVSSPIFMDK